MQVQSRGVAGGKFRPVALAIEVRVSLDSVLKEFSNSGEISVTGGASAVMKNGSPDVMGFRYHFFVTTPRNLGVVVSEGESDMQVSSLGETCSLAHIQGLSTFDPYLVAHFVHQYCSDEDVFPRDVRVCFATRSVVIGEQQKKYIIRVQRRAVTLWVGTIPRGEEDYKIDADAPIVFLKEIWPINGWIS